MKLYDFGATVLALSMIATFAYGTHVANTVTDYGTKKATVKDVKAHVKADLAKFEPSTIVVYNK